MHEREPVIPVSQGISPWMLQELSAARTHTSFWDLAFLARMCVCVLVCAWAHMSELLHVEVRGGCQLSSSFALLTLKLTKSARLAR